MNNLFIATSRKISKLLSPELRRKGVRMFFVVFAISLLELLGLAVVIPLLVVIVSDRKIDSHPILSEISNALSLHSTQDFVLFLCVSVTLFSIVKNLFTIYLYRVQSKYIFSVYRFLTAKLLRAYYLKGLAYIRKNNSLAIIHNINSLCLFFSQTIVNSILGVVNESIVILLMLGIVFIYEPTVIALLLLTVFPICLVFYRVVKTKINAAGHKFQKYQISQNKIASETIKGYVDLEIKNKFDFYYRKHAANADKISRVQTSLTTLMQMPQKVIELGIILGLVAIILMGQYYYHDYSRLAVLLGLFGIMAFRLLPSLNRIVTFTLNLKHYQYAFEIFDDVQLSKVDRYMLPTSDRLSFNRSIRLDSIVFSYDSASPVLNKLNIEVNKGEIIGIIGRSGTGKSTLLNLMLNFVEPESGIISVDGIEITKDNVDKWRNIIGYVPQDVFIAEASLAENIAFAEDTIDEVQLNKAIDLASLTDFVAGLPKGVNTCLTEGGANLSGGQRQRIGIARALYKNAEVLFFDEATSSLDSRTEEEISSSIRVLSLKERSITIIIIAHRITTLKYCSRIVELKAGRIEKELKYEQMSS